MDRNSSLYGRIFFYTVTNIFYPVTFLFIRSQIFLSDHIFRFTVTTLFLVTRRASDKMSEALLFVFTQFFFISIDNPILIY